LLSPRYQSKDGIYCVTIIVNDERTANDSQFFFFRWRLTALVATFKARDLYRHKFFLELFRHKLFRRILSIEYTLCYNIACKLVKNSAKSNYYGTH
jgi:hypothetical protein